MRQSVILSLMVMSCTQLSPPTSQDASTKSPDNTHAVVDQRGHAVTLAAPVLSGTGDRAAPRPGVAAAFPPTLKPL